MLEQTQLTYTVPFDAYKRWSMADMPAWMKQELAQMDEAAIKECFGSQLAFGTGGLRAEIGAGTNRINMFTVRKVTKGLADYLNQLGGSAPERGVAIAYDSRRFSKEFADEAALVLAENGVRAYVFDELRPTPLLSFAVRHLGTAAGIVITASHNPPEYNGYKVYGEDGCQLPPAAADAITEAVDRVENELTVRVMDKAEAIEKELYISIGHEVEEAYHTRLLKGIQNTAAIREAGDTLKIVYTPLHGSGNRPVREILARAGFRNVLTVKEQELPDSEFSTVSSPNPEEKAALALAIDLASANEADIVLGTDPDADRVGVAVRKASGEYVCLTGNQTGALMLDYILSQRQYRNDLPSNGIVMKTIVTSELGRVIASRYGVETMDTLTGFKYIGEKIAQFEQTGEKQFLFGYEESYGYLFDAFVRDKDAVQSCLLVSEMAAYYKTKGMTLDRVLDELYRTHGYFMEGLHSITLTGLEGIVRINQMTNYLREHLISKIGSWRVSSISDYQSGSELHLTSNTRKPIDLPSSNVVKYILDDGAWFAVRPSGTEPKLKIYFSVIGETAEEAQNKLSLLRDQVLNLMDNIKMYLGLEVVQK
ncbi:phospho-sugar mutase [Paenibacillus turpanensis]|uniref:phospho-sugar mutase n=1 Tax=Paenibacillus turpanensis TaxID=2689078 RepID=UPI00140CDC54|nr:phospho-sugar mutase [Paenibacillus turpanensis]